MVICILIRFLIKRNGGSGLRIIIAPRAPGSSSSPTVVAISALSATTSTFAQFVEDIEHLVIWFSLDHLVFLILLLFLNPFTVPREAGRNFLKFGG